MLESQPQRGVARLLSGIEDENPRAVEVLQATWSRTGNSYVIGVTGPPGGGKSTLVDCLAVHAAAQGHAVGVLAVDPTSPFSGGAVLGDRLRMSDAQKRGIFIRSVATRGHLGGLYLGGSCCHPSGNVTGLPGYNAAQVLLGDLGLRAEFGYD